MSKLIISATLSLLGFLCNQQLSKVEVIKKATAIKVEPGYALKDDDSTFTYHGDKYYIISNEAFNEKGDIVRASVAGDVGYSIYTQRDFTKYKRLIDDHSFTKHIDIQLINDKSAMVNNRKIAPIEVDKLNKQIYYNLKSRDTLYRICYK